MSTKGSGRGSGERYDVEFKQEAVRLLLTSGKTASQLARELGVSSRSLSRWKQDYLKASGEIEVESQMRSAVKVEQENRQFWMAEFPRADEADPEPFAPALSESAWPVIV